MRKEEEVKQIIDDLIYIKTAISKNTNIFKFISIADSFRTVFLITGIAITLIAGFFYRQIQLYGSYQAVPQEIKTMMYLAIAAVVLLVGIIKVRNIITAAKRVHHDITLMKLITEVYTDQALLIMIPMLLSLIAVTVFFVLNEHYNYIVPFLAILFGLLCNSLVNIFYLKELVIIGGWLILTGMVSLFGLMMLHPLIILIITFGVGLILMYFVCLALAASEKE